MKSISNLRPKPPPKKVVLIFTRCLEAQGRGHHFLCPLRDLRGSPDCTAVRRYPGGGVHRFHSRVSQKRQRIDRLDRLRRLLQRCRRVAIGLRDRALITKTVVERRSNALAVERCVGSLIPLRAQRL